MVINFQIIKFIIEIVSLLTIIISLIIAIKRLKTLNEQLNLLKKQYSNEFEWKKRENSLKYSGLYHPLTRESKQILQEEFDLYRRNDSIPKKEFIDKIDKNPSIQVHINHLLTYYENISLATQKSIVDIDIIYDMVGKTMVLLKKKLINYIDYHRTIANNDALWKEFESVATIFEKRAQTPSKKLDKIG